MATQKIHNLIEKIKRNFAGRPAESNADYFEIMEPRLLLSGVKAADALPLVIISATDAKAAESVKDNQTATFKVSRAGGDKSQDLVVYYAISGSAANGTDYDALSGQLTILAGKSYATITLRPNDDALAETSETVTLTLSANDAYSLGAVKKQSAVATITDNEAVVTLKATDRSAMESANGKQTATYVVSRTGGDLKQDLVVHYTISGNADNGDDFETLTGQVTILAGKKSATITVKPVDDAENESLENVTVTLAANNAYNIAGAGTGTVTIKDWELAPESIQGLSFDATAKTSSGVLTNLNGYKLFVASENTQLTEDDDGDPDTKPFAFLNKKGNWYDTAEVLYTRISSTQATITTTNLFDYGPLTGTITFTSATSATFDFTVENGHQTGNLKLMTGTGYAPSSMNNWTVKGSITTGFDTFASHGSFSITTVNDDSYTIKAFGQTGTGTINSLRKVNDRLFVVDAYDNTLNDNVEMVLEFTSAKKANYYLTDYIGYQRGTVSFATAPTLILGGSAATGVVYGVVVTAILASHDFLQLPVLSRTDTAYTASGYTTTGGCSFSISVNRQYSSSLFDIFVNNYAQIRDGFTDGRNAATTRMYVTLDQITVETSGSPTLIFAYNPDSLSWQTADGINLADINPTFAALWSSASS